MGTKYSTNAASGYNATPPSDDGTVSESNKVKYSTVKTKLADPVKDLADTINSELVTHFDRGPTALTSNTTLGATHYNQFIQASGASVTLTLTDASTLTAGWYCDVVNTDSNNDIAIARATASNTINSLSNDVVLLPLQAARIFVNAAANGFLYRDIPNLQSTDAGAGVGPKHTLYRNSASPAASDLIGGYYFDGEDSAGNRETYARIYSQIDDPGSTSEDGSLKIDVMKAGTLTLAVTLSQSALNLASGFSFQENGVSISGASSGSSIVLLEHVSDINATTKVWNNTLITSTYDTYLINFGGLTSSGDNAVIQLLGSKNNGSTYEATNYFAGAKNADFGASTTLWNLGLGSNINNGSTKGLTGWLWIHNPLSTTLVKTISWDICYYKTGTGQPRNTSGSGVWDQTGAGNFLNAFKLSFEVGATITGPVTLYGVKKS